MNAIERVREATREEFIEALALAFGNRLVNEIGMENLKIAAQRNESDTDEGVCHSHDFCDANMLMFDAFVGVFGREPELDKPYDYAAWAEAWDYAKAHRLFADHWLGC